MFEVPIPSLFLPVSIFCCLRNSKRSRQRFYHIVVLPSETAILEHFFFQISSKVRFKLCFLCRPADSTFISQAISPLDWRSRPHWAEFRPWKLKGAYTRILHRFRSFQLLVQYAIFNYKIELKICAHLFLVPHFSCCDIFRTRRTVPLTEVGVENPYIQFRTQ